MKVGDLVIVNVPEGASAFDASTMLDATQGLIVEMKEHSLCETDLTAPVHRWWYVLRSDTGRIEKFHDNWVEVTDEGR